VPAAGAAYQARLAAVTPGTQTLTFAPEADARVEEPTPGVNFGTSSSLRMDRAASGGQDVETYMRFGLDGIAGRVTRARLRLRSTGNTIHGVEVFGAAGNWTETQITFANRPAFTPGAVARVDVIDAQQWVEWDVTSLVTGDGPLNLRLAITGDDGITFHSREASNQTLRPELVVDVLNDAYARPKGATPTRFSLVPAYRQCASANRVHGPPLAHPSCNPPVQQSGELTIGSPDANGAASVSSGFAGFEVLGGSPSTPADEADVRLQVSITDVRRRADMADYTGNLQASTTMRVTDRVDGTSTVSDIALPVQVPCTATAGEMGSTCAVTTTLDAINPGTVDEGSRAVWQLSGFELLDASAEVFARPGVFVP